MMFASHQHESLWGVVRKCQFRRQTVMMLTTFAWEHGCGCGGVTMSLLHRRSWKPDNPNPCPAIREATSSRRTVPIKFKTTSVWFRADARELEQCRNCWNQLQITWEGG